MEEADTTADLLDALAALCDHAVACKAPLFTDVFTLGMDTMPQEFMLRLNYCLFIRLPSTDVTSLLREVQACTVVWQELPRACHSAVYGSGFGGRVVAHERSIGFHVIPRTSDDVVADYVVLDDICVQVREYSNVYYLLPEHSATLLATGDSTKLFEIKPQLAFHSQ